MGERALLLVNRDSRSGAGHIGSLVACLAQRGTAVLQPELHRASQIPELIRRYRDAVGMVIIGGGDGSMNAAAPALVETGLPLGILPLGTANDLARTLGIPLDPEQACAVITDGVRHRIDLGVVNGHYFFNVAHIGLGAHVTRTLASGTKQRWGGYAYLAGLVRALRTRRSFRAEIVCDGRHARLRAMQIAIGNGRFYGGGMTVEERSCIDDGRFFLFSVAPIGWRELLRLLLHAHALRAGRFAGHDPVRVEHGRDIEIRTSRRMAVSADGEIVGTTPAHFSVAVAALDVFVPVAYFHDRQEDLHVAQG